jgi:hypothetical protein
VYTSEGLGTNACVPLLPCVPPCCHCALEVSPGSAGSLHVRAARRRAARPLRDPRAYSSAHHPHTHHARGKAAPAGHDAKKANVMQMFAAGGGANAAVRPREQHRP